MQGVREIWSTDRGRLVHYFVALVLAIYLVIEMALNSEATGSQVALASSIRAIPGLDAGTRLGARRRT